MSKIRKKLNIILLIVGIILSTGCTNQKNEVEHTKSEIVLSKDEYINKIGSDVSLLINSVMWGEINLKVAKESCENIINIEGIVKDEKLKEYQDSINEKVNLIKLKCEYVLNNSESQEINGIEGLVEELSQTVLLMINKLNIDTDNKGVIACMSDLNSLVSTMEEHDIIENEEVVVKEEVQSNETIKSYPDILGKYTYDEYNKHGIGIESNSITITGAKDETWSFVCDSYYLQHAYSLDGQMVNREDVTQELVDQGNTLGRGSMMNGYIRYLGNNVWNGYIGYEEENPTIPCEILKNGNSITLTYDGQSITYKK